MAENKKKKSIYCDIPSGLAAKLVRNPEALSYYKELSAKKQQNLIDYVQGGLSVTDTKARICEAVDMLSRHETEFK